MRIALLSYRTKTHSGGQGVYVRHLSWGLAELGHEVTVFSGQPYPEQLDPRVRLEKVPSLDLYREDDPFRTPHPREFRDWIDGLEYAQMITAAFPEPLTFSLRIRRLFGPRAADFDIVHDNQSLGYGLLSLVRRGVPLVTTIHHPISKDRRLDIAAAPLRKQITTRRWYRFVRMQARVARRLPSILGVSSISAADTAHDFGIDPDRMTVIPLGVDTDLFAPRGARIPGRVVAVASADKPLKGVPHLLDAIAKLRTEHEHVTLHLVSPVERSTVARLRELGIEHAVTIHSGISDEQLAELMASAEVMAVPSLYEGFSLPTVEAMSCGTPVVASRAGALPEVVGDAGVLVELGDVEALVEQIGALFDSPERREHYSRAGRERAVERFSWVSVARATVEAYEREIARVERLSDTEVETDADR
ncbi:glycosyltransferase family 4 protein [Aeromicrobium sp. YIM 150415]|uniref:glycosyltransferase family 4 protein n=1 Tax=Aeromicrobium sp. YIM 150415 TaxID=2803912 RepID=UPI0019660DC2|nr:glycosyltransferase family 4 protein [Aeromicrobium sp. YIM 150415]MBM9465258.1 glycosyltransferase family 4 protein [Aeromicrobium sp. YIM 150415]